jgi:hypothetical protein
MTVFCALYSDVELGEEAVLISDVLLTTSVRQSNDGDRYRRTYIPSVGGTFPQVSGEVSIAGLGQKLYVTEAGACFAVAGDLERACRFHAALSLAQDIDEISKTCSLFKDDLQFAVFFPNRTKGTNHLCASMNCKVMRTGPYGLVVIGGSGETTLRQLLLRQAEQPIHGDETVLPIARALCLVNEVLAMDETHSDITLGARFGAYYEIAAYNDGIYLKLDHVAHHYLRFVTDGDHGYWSLTKSYYHEYLDEDLIVRRVVMGQENGESVVWQDCYIVGGLSGSLDLAASSSHIINRGPSPIWEVLSLDVGGCVVRIVSTARHLLKPRLSQGRWYFSIDEDVGRDVYREILSSFGST